MARGAALAAIVIIIAGAAFIYSWHPPIEEVDRPSAGGFAPELVERGAQLSAIGNCQVCHTARGGQQFAGGLPVETPFGTIHSTNITPDPETGIGKWSEEAFNRAMREGVDRAGNHLYPAFPYDHFTRITDEDNRALYAFLMTRESVEAGPPQNDLIFPLGFRPLIAGWKLLFLDRGPYEPDPDQSAEWNHGAYLVEGAGHCGACHTPRNFLGAAKSGAHFDGGEIEGWHAYALNENSPAPIPWDAEKLAFYLANGWHAEHGISRGPMAPVTINLATAPREDVKAMATYIASQMGTPDDARRAEADRLLSEIRTPPDMQAAGDTHAPPSPAEELPGAQLYAAACASCHSGQRPLPLGGIDLRLSSGIAGPTPENAINVVLDGLPAAPGQASAIMPGFDGAISDQQLADLLAYMRARFTDQPAWEDMEGYIRKRRESGAKVEAMHGMGAAPADPAHEVSQW